MEKEDVALSALDLTPHHVSGHSPNSPAKVDYWVANGRSLRMTARGERLG